MVISDKLAAGSYDTNITDIFYHDSSAGQLIFDLKL